MKDMFSFLSMSNNYSERKIDRYEDDILIVDTCAVDDGEQPFETAVAHPFYNNGEYVIVEAYSSTEEAQEGHNKWLQKMQTNPLPDKLIDCCNSEIQSFAALVGTNVVFNKEEFIDIDSFEDNQ